MNRPNQEPQTQSEFKSKPGLQRIWHAFGYSLAGLKSAWQNEQAFRQELVLVVIGTIIALLIPVSGFEKLFLIASLILILIVELINSAIEAIVDRISLERHPLSKNAKDYGSAAVLLTCVIAAATWGLVLYDRFYY
jgi:diacylglycerol kinase (ATP)